MRTVLPGKVEAVLLGRENPDEQDLTPKPEGMRWATYERWVGHYDGAERMPDAQLVTAAARLMKWLGPQGFVSCIRRVSDLMVSCNEEGDG